MAIELSKEQIAKINVVQRMLRDMGLPKSLIDMRVNNYRRTLTLDMTSYKGRARPYKRQEMISEGKLPSTITPNAKAAKRLDARVRAFEAMKSLDQAAHTRPGSLSK